MKTLDKEAISTNKQSIIDAGKELFRLEAQALLDIEKTLGDDFYRAVEMILPCKGRVVVIGMGKSGHIGAKIAATLASTGTPAFFVHPAEMGHGDLGMLKPEDVAIGISFSGNTGELRKILTPVKRLGLPLISITGNGESILAELSDVVLHTPIDKEACPLNLAPTSSTTAALAMGDALAVALMHMRNFSKEDFAKSHPLGSLGRSLTRVSDVMRKNTDLPKVSTDSDLATVLTEINNKKLGLTTVINSSGELVGAITDGDLRRAQIKFAADIVNKTAEEIMSLEPKTIKESEMAVTALKIMEDHRISDLVIIDQNKNPVGIIDLKDLLKAGLL